MHNARREATPVDGVTLFHKFVNLRYCWGGHPQEMRLNVEMFIKFEILFVNQDRRVGCFVKRGEAADVIDMRVRADDGADFQIMLAENFQDAANFVAGIDDDGFMRGRIA